MSTPPPFENCETLGKVLNLRRYPILNRLVDILLCILSVDIPRSVSFGNNVRLNHNCYGTVINCNTVIEDNVQIYQGVTIGRGDVWNKKKCSRF